MEEAHKSVTGALRRNKGKPEPSQLDPKFLLEMASLMTDIANSGKYPKYNWAKGMEYSTVLDSLDRHIIEFKLGNDYDDETGRHHIIHAAVNAMILWNSCMKDIPELDDRFFKEKK